MVVVVDGLVVDEVVVDELVDEDVGVLVVVEEPCVWGGTEVGVVLVVAIGTNEGGVKEIGGELEAVVPTCTTSPRRTNGTRVFPPR